MSDITAVTTQTSNTPGDTALAGIKTALINLNADKTESAVSVSVDSEIALFSSTTGKVIKRASGTGIVKATAGVISYVTAPSGAIVGDTDSQTLTNKTLTTPTIASFVNATHNHSNAAGGGTLAESVITFTDITTNNVSATKHGYTPKLPNDATKYLDGTGAYSVPTPSFIGSWTTVTNDTVVQAATAGFVVGYITGGGGTPTYSILTDSSNPPTTQRAAGSGANSVTSSFCVPIKKSDYYKVVTAGGATVTAFFIPIGT